MLNLFPGITEMCSVYLIIYEKSEPQMRLSQGTKMAMSFICQINAGQFFCCC